MRTTGEIVYLNGSLIPRSQARISPRDFGFLYGYGLFETMRAYSGRIFRIESHLERLEYSARRLGLQVNIFDLKAAVLDTLDANQLQDARVRITVSAGEGEMIPDPATCVNPTVLITAGHYQPYSEQVYNRGFSVSISPICRNSRSPLAMLKTTSYLESMLAKRDAKSSGFDDTFLLNEKGLLAEASMSNIFIVSGGKLRTPGKQSGILSGITRDLVLTLASQLDIDAVAQDVGLDELFLAEESFITNSLIEIMPVTAINNRPVGTGSTGPVTIRLMNAYRSLIITED